MPGSEGAWDIIEIFRWRCDRLKAASGGGKTQDILDLEKRELAAIVEKRELDARTARGEMLPKDVVHVGMTEVFVALRGGLEVLQRKFGPEAHAILEQTIQGGLKRIAELFGTDDETDLADNQG